jgi:cytochrome oxidase assembly protein ShyY1
LANEILEQDWPKYVQELDYAKAKSDLGQDLNNSVIQLSAGSIGALEPIWKPIELKPSRHYGYAVQWFGLALVLICSFLHFGFKKD